MAAGATFTESGGGRDWGDEQISQKLEQLILSSIQLLMISTSLLHCFISLLIIYDPFFSGRISVSQNICPCTWTICRKMLCNPPSSLMAPQSLHVVGVLNGLLL